MPHDKSMQITHIFPYTNHIPMVKVAAAEMRQQLSAPHAERHAGSNKIEQTGPETYKSTNTTITGTDQ